MTQTLRGRILVVDDTEEMRYATSRMLRAGGYEVVEAACGLEALEKARQQPDLVVLDIHLPDISGYEVCRRLKADEATASIPVLHLTATYREAEDRAASLEGGADAFLNEPVEPRELIASVEALVRMRNAEKRARRAIDELERHRDRLEEAVAERTAQLRELLGQLDRRVAEKTEEIRRGEEKYRRIVDTANEGIWQVDLDSRTTFVNRRMAELLGYAPEEMIGKNPRDFVDEEERAEVDRRIALSKKGLSESSERRFRRKDGSETWVHLARSPVLSEDGSPAGVVAMVTDISERKRAETYLELRRAVLQELNEPGTLRDAIRRVVGVLKRMTGFDAVGIRLEAGDDFPYLFQEGFSEEFLRTENSLVERGPGGGVCRNEDGSIRLECTCGLVISGRTDPSSPLFTPGGSCWTNDALPLLDLPAAEDPRLNPRNECIHQGYASVALVPIRSGGRILGLIQLNDRRRDRLSLGAVSQLERLAERIGTALSRKRAEEELRESEERYRALSEELERRVAERTEALEKSRKLLDETAHLSRVGGWEYDVRTGEVNWTDVTCEIHEVEPGTPQTVGADVDYYSPESRPRIAALLERAVAAGEPFDGELELITAKGRRLWVRAVGRAYRENGEVVRIAGVLQDVDERRRRRIALEEANRELEAYSYSVAHELRTPLRAIDGFSARIARAYDALLDDEGRRLFERVRWNAQRMGLLIDDLLVFSQAGRVDLDRSAVDMTGAARAAFAQVTADGEARSRITFLLGDLPEARGHAVLLRRVWESLLSNAVKFTATREKPEIRVDGRIEGGEAVYRVTDNGVGFDMRYVDKLFGVFQRLYGLAEFEGTGIGLALVRRIAIRHGGRVWATGEVDRGATFCFSLPLKDGSGAAARPAAPGGR